MRSAAFDSAAASWQGTRLPIQIAVLPPNGADTPVPKVDLGEKQLCPNCGSKFYDLHKRPAQCPKCGHAFDPEDEAVKATRAKARMSAFSSKVVEDEEDEEEDDDTVVTKLNKAAVASDDDDEVEAAEEVTPEIDAADVDAVPLALDDDEEGDPAPGEPISEGFSEQELEDDDPTSDDDEVPFLEDEDEDFEDGIGDLPEGEEDDLR